MATRHSRLGSQAEPIAVIILTVVGLAIALMTWSWINAKLGPVSTQAMLQQYLAFERSREYADLLASGVNATSGYKLYIVELMHVIVTSRRWFAFVLLVNMPNETTLFDPTLTAQLNQAYSTGGVKVTLLYPDPAYGTYVPNSTPVQLIQVDPRDVILADGRSLYDHGINATVVVVKVPEYYSGIGDPTPQALVDIQVAPTLLPADARPILVTLTLFNNKWYEVTRIMLP